MNKEQIGLQELAEFMRNATYSDNQKHKIDWSLMVVHPKTNDGDVGFSGGLWNSDGTEILTSISFSYSKTKGIYNFQSWKNGSEIRYSFGDAPNFEDFKNTVIKMFEIEKLYEC